MTPNMKTYRLRVLALMTVYVVLIFLVFPYAKSVENVAMKVALSLLQVAPVIAVLWLMVVQVMRSDELQQRLHLLALSVATGVVAATSLIGGFLSAVHAIALDGDVLIWVFPALCFSYGAARVLIARRYGGSGCEE